MRDVNSTVDGLFGQNDARASLRDAAFDASCAENAPNVVTRSGNEDTALRER